MPDDSREVQRLTQEVEELRRAVVALRRWAQATAEALSLPGKL